MHCPEGQDPKQFTLDFYNRAQAMLLGQERVEDEVSQYHRLALNVYGKAYKLYENILFGKAKDYTQYVVYLQAASYIKALGLVKSERIDEPELKNSALIGATRLSLEEIIATKDNTLYKIASLYFENEGRYREAAVLCAHEDQHRSNALAVMAKL